MAKRVAPDSERLQRVLSNGGNLHDMASAKARHIFDAALARSMTFEDALGQIYIQAVHDSAALAPVRTRKRKAEAADDREAAVEQ